MTAFARFFDILVVAVFASYVSVSTSATGIHALTTGNGLRTKLIPHPRIGVCLVPVTHLQNKLSDPSW